MSSVQSCELTAAAASSQQPGQQLSNICVTIEATSQGCYIAGTMHCKLLCLLQLKQLLVLQN